MSENRNTKISFKRILPTSFDPKKYNIGDTLELWNGVKVVIDEAAEDYHQPYSHFCDNGKNKCYFNQKGWVCPNCFTIGRKGIVFIEI